MKLMPSQSSKTTLLPTDPLSCIAHDDDGKLVFLAQHALVVHIHAEGILQDREQRDLTSTARKERTLSYLDKTNSTTFRGGGGFVR